MKKGLSWLITAVAVAAVILPATAASAATTASAAPAITAITTAPAVAPVGSCLDGLYAGYCGHQTDTPYGLTMTVGSGMKIYNKLFLTPNTQFVWENPPGVTVTDNAKIALWFPMLPFSQYAITQVGTFAVVSPYIKGDKYQQWVAVPVTGGFAWQNEATGDYIDGHAFSQTKPVTMLPYLGSADAYNFLPG